MCDGRFAVDHKFGSRLHYLDKKFNGALRWASASGKSNSFHNVAFRDAFFVQHFLRMQGDALRVPAFLSSDYGPRCSASDASPTYPALENCSICVKNGLCTGFGGSGAGCVDHGCNGKWFVTSMQSLGEFRDFRSCKFSQSHRRTRSRSSPARSSRLLAVWKRSRKGKAAAIPRATGS